MSEKEKTYLASHYGCLFVKLPSVKTGVFLWDINKLSEPLPLHLKAPHISIHPSDQVCYIPHHLVSAWATVPWIIHTSPPPGPWWSLGRRVWVRPTLWFPGRNRLWPGEATPSKKDLQSEKQYRFSLKRATKVIKCPLPARIIKAFAGRWKGFSSGLIKKHVAALYQVVQFSMVYVT